MTKNKIPTENESSVGIFDVHFLFDYLMIKPSVSAIKSEE